MSSFDSTKFCHNLTSKPLDKTSGTKRNSLANENKEAFDFLLIVSVGSGDTSSHGK